MQYVVASPEPVSALDGQQIGRLLHHADRLGAPPRIGTDRARVALGEREAERAETRLVLHGDERVGEGLGVLPVRAQHVEREAGGGLLPDAGQLRQLLDQPGHRRGLGHPGGFRASRAA